MSLIHFRPGIYRPVLDCATKVMEWSRASDATVTKVLSMMKVLCRNAFAKNSGSWVKGLLQEKAVATRSERSDGLRNYSIGRRHHRLRLQVLRHQPEQACNTSNWIHDWTQSSSSSVICHPWATGAPKHALIVACSGILAKMVEDRNDSIWFPFHWSVGTIGEYRQVDLSACNFPNNIIFLMKIWESLQL